MHINPNVLCSSSRMPQGHRCFQTWKMRLTVRHTNPYNNDFHVRPLIKRLTTAVNAQPHDPAPTTKPPSHPQVTTSKRLTLSTKGHQNLLNRHPRPSQNFQSFRVLAPMMGTAKTSPNSDDGIKHTQLKVWQHEQLRACVRCIFKKNTEIVVQKIMHCTRN